MILPHVLGISSLKKMWKLEMMAKLTLPVNLSPHPNSENSKIHLILFLTDKKNGI